MIKFKYRPLPIFILLCPGSIYCGADHFVPRQINHGGFITPSCPIPRVWVLQANWSLIVTAPNVEFTVAERLRRLNVEFLLIKCRSERIFNGRRIARLVVAFPRYIFVCVCNAWQKVLNINGVVDFVRIGMQPAIIDDKVINDLQSRLTSEGILPVVVKSRFSFGQKAVIARGVYSGQHVIFQYPLSNGRVCVLQQWFSALRHVEVDEVDLVEVGDYRAARNLLRRRRRRIHRDFQRRSFEMSPRATA